MEDVDQIAHLIEQAPQQLPQLGSIAFSQQRLELILRRTSLLRPWLLACAQQSTEEQIQAQIKEGQRMGPSNNVHWFDALLDLTRQHYTEKECGQLIVGYLMEILKNAEDQDLRPSLNMLLEHYNLAMREDLASTPHETFGIMEFVVQLIRTQDLKLRASQKQGEAEKFYNIFENVVRHLVQSGVSMDTHRSATFGDETVVFEGVLHRACHDHDKNAPNAMAINILLSCGADWKTPLNRGLISLKAQDVMAPHPAVRRAKLTDIAQSKSNSTKPPKSKI